MIVNTISKACGLPQLIHFSPRQGASKAVELGEERAIGPRQCGKILVSLFRIVFR